MHRIGIRRMAIVALLALFGVACGGAEEGTDTTVGGTADSDVVSVAIIMPSEINDLSWSQQGYTGLNALQERGLIEFAYSESVAEDAASASRVLRGYAEEGYDLIIAHSFPYQDAVFEVAEEFPEINFAWPNAGLDRTAPNLSGYDERFYEAEYLIGILAGGVTESGVLGGVGAFDIPECHSMFAAFELGAKTVRDDITQINAYTGDWLDIVKASEAVIAQADQGADVFVTCGSSLAQAAITTTKERDISAVGFVGDMSAIAPEGTLASVVWNLEGMFELMVNDVANDTFMPGKIYRPGVPEGIVTVGLNPDYGKEIPQEVMEQYEQAQADIESGTFEVPFIPEG